MTKNTKDLGYYLSLRYPVTIIPEETGYSITIPDLPGCTTQGETINAALENIEEAKAGWLEVAIEEGFDIPEPEHDREFSGKFIIRTSRSLHKRLVMAAKMENVSLNLYVNSLLSARSEREVSDRILRVVRDALSQIASQRAGAIWDNFLFNTNPLPESVKSEERVFRPQRAAV